MLPLASVQAKTSNEDKLIDKGRPVQKEVELIDERSATSQVFMQEDGSYRLEIDSEPVHVKNKETKKWEKIDNTIIKKKNGRFHNKKSQFDASFSSSVGPDSPIVSIEKEGKKIEIKTMHQNGKPTSGVAAEVAENRVQYKEIYPKTDLGYTVGNSTIKEDIILKEKPVANDSLEYSFDFDMTGLSLETTNEGDLFLVDPVSKERIFTIEKPVMMDSSIPDGFVSRLEKPMPEGSVSDQVEMNAVQEGTALHITLKPDMEWISSTERVYPLVIDPTVKVFQPKNELNDTTIRSALPDQTGGADLELGAGLHSTSNNTVRSLMQFNLGTLPAGAKVMNAQLNLRLSSVWNDTASSIGLYEVTNPWEENKATWQRRTSSALWTAKGGDTNSTLLSSQTIGALNTTSPEPQLFKWVIDPEIVQKWMGTPSKNLGVMLKATNEKAATYKKFYSGDYSGKLQYSPKLTITYFPVSRLGLESYWSYAEHDLTDGQGYVNLGTGNLVLDFTDFSITGRGNSGFSFSRTYNSKAVDDSPVGVGWSYTGSDTVAEFPNRDVLYTDSDGTAHLFTYDDATKTFKAPPGLYMQLVKANTDAFVLTDFNGNRVVFRDLIKNPEQQGRIYPIDYEEDRNKNKISYQRGTDGTLKGITDATGRILSLSYDTKGRIISGTFGGVEKFSYSYHMDGRLKSSTLYTDALTGSTTTYAYNTAGELVSIVDPNKQATNYIYNAGFLTQVKQPTISAVESEVSYEYNIQTHISTERDKYGNETVYRLSDNYMINSITDPMKGISYFRYDTNYNLEEMIDPNGSKSSSTYDSKGNILTSIDRLGTKTTYTYNSYSLPLTVSIYNDSTLKDDVTRYVYNEYGDVIQEINSKDETTEYTYYEPYGNLKTMTPPGGIAENYEYDTMQNYPTKFEDALKRKTSIVNDKYGNATEITDPIGNRVNYEYNEQEQVIKAVDENDKATTYDYDSNGNLIAIHSPRKTTVNLSYNNQNQMVSREEPMHQKTSYEYDALGNMTKVTKHASDPINNIITRTDYDANNRPINIFINEILKWNYIYDKNGNTTAVKNAETNEVSEYTYDNEDKLQTESNGKQSIAYNYSSTELLTKIQGTSIGAKLVHQFTNKFVFDQADQLQNWYRNNTVQGTYVYEKSGDPKQRRYLNQVITDYAYDSVQQLQQVKVTQPGAITLLQEDIGYDLNGSITSITSAKGNKAYTYDKAGQLTFQEINSAQLKESYTYDPVGNRLMKSTVKNGLLTETAYLYDENNRLTKVGGKVITYDEQGNRKRDNHYTYEYNKFDQLKSISTDTGTLIATYSYDDEGRRTSKTVGGKTTRYHYDQGINVLFETDSSGTITADYIYDPDGLPLMMNKDGINYYYVYNSLKEIVGLTNPDGKLVASYSYDAWGNILTQSGPMATENPYRYKGYRYDEEIGLYYLIARYYQPEEGVFLTPDPEGGDLDNPKTQNGYTYANNNPVMMTDADGNYAWAIINAGFAVYDGYKAYQSGKKSGKKGWALAGSVAWASGSSFVKVGHLKRAGKLLGVASGSFSSVNKGKKAGTVAHHIPQNAFNKTIGVSRGKGPAVLMTKTDHSVTRTFAGRGKATMKKDSSLSARQRLATDVMDVKRHTGRKYNEGLKKAVRHGQSIYPKR